MNVYFFVYNHISTLLILISGWFCIHQSENSSAKRTPVNKLIWKFSGKLSYYKKSRSKLNFLHINLWQLKYDHISKYIVLMPKLQFYKHFHNDLPTKTNYLKIKSDVGWKKICNAHVFNFFCAWSFIMAMHD